MSEQKEQSQEELDTNIFLKKKRKQRLKRWILILLCIFVLLPAFLRGFVLEAFKIPSVSMVPTLLEGDHLLIDKRAYGLWLPFMNKKFLFGEGPERGDVVVFLHPKIVGKNYIKRVIGLPGDRIAFHKGILYLNEEALIPARLGSYSFNKWRGRIIISSGSKFEESIPRSKQNKKRNRYQIFLRKSPVALHKKVQIHIPTTSKPTKQWIVKPGHVFVLGDFREQSFDSRHWGQVPIEKIKGRAFLILFSRHSKFGSRWTRALTKIR